MDQRFKNISYDLGENILYVEENELKCLKHYSLMSSIVSICRESRILDFIFENVECIISSTEPSGYFEIA
ncbi:UNVERIFIED_CONTAM: hypothetical protein RMT77_019428 [Armadillidium vulgare]